MSAILSIGIVIIIFFIIILFFGFSSYECGFQSLCGFLGSSYDIFDSEYVSVSVVLLIIFLTFLATFLFFNNTKQKSLIKSDGSLNFDTSSGFGDLSPSGGGGNGGGGNGGGGSSGGGSSIGGFLNSVNQGLGTLNNTASTYQNLQPLVNSFSKSSSSLGNSASGLSKYLPEAEEAAAFL
jgi:uncharacterized membrane protein